jgi:hypothetical protein
MKRTLVMILAVVVASALFAALVYAVLIVARVAEPAGTTVYGLTARRLWATLVAMMALAGVVVGGLALARPMSRLGTARAATLTLGLGLAGVVVMESSAEQRRLCWDSSLSRWVGLRWLAAAAPPWLPRQMA